MANVFKLQLDIQSKSNFAHKVEPKLNIVRLLLLFRVYGWKVFIMLTREPVNKDDRAFSIHLVYEEKYLGNARQILHTAQSHQT